MFAPKPETVESVRDWLVQFGISLERLTHSDNKGFIAFDATVEEADALLATEFRSFEHVATGHVSFGCDRYVLLVNLQFQSC